MTRLPHADASVPCHDVSKTTMNMYTDWKCVHDTGMI